MPAIAMGFLSVTRGGAYPSQSIFTIGHQIEVPRVDANSYSTNMIKHFVRWNFRAKRFEENTMCKL